MSFLMPRIKLTLQYKGTRYHGWQNQPNGLTIQEVLEKTLYRLLGTRVNVVGSGRTDSGVHALGQVCHFDLVDSRDPYKLLMGLNSLLPHDIAVIDIETISDTFHAQRSAKKKTYQYFIYNSAIKSPFLEEITWRVIFPLNLEKMKKAAQLLVGEHDFKSFCASDSGAKTTVRKIYKIKMSNSPQPPLMLRGGVRGNHPGPLLLTSKSGLIKISITGSGFLKQMVRTIVGTLVEVGRGRISLTQFKKILKAQDRKLAGKTAPARGLFLKEVKY